MIPRHIHQIFYNIGKGELNDISAFRDGLHKTKMYCEEKQIKHTLWSEEDCLQLLEDYKEYRELYDSFCQPIMKIDFMRLLILHKYGGIYIDLDVHPINDITPLFDRDAFFVHWHNDTKKTPYNAILGTEPHTDLYKSIIAHCKESYYEKRSMPIYKTWTGRLVYQTTGHHMINRVLKKKKFDRDDILDIVAIFSKGKYIGKTSGNLFMDFNVSVWYC
jgi:mannosyltransferase OCH1-like enzyme